MSPKCQDPEAQDAQIAELLQKLEKAESLLEAVRSGELAPSLLPPLNGSTHVLREHVAAERLARSILEQATEAFLVCDTAGRVVRASQGATALLGFSPVGQIFKKVCTLKPCSASSLLYRDVAAQAIEGIKISSVEFLLPTPDVTRHVLLSAGPLRAPKDQCMGCVISLTDITSQRHAEEKALELQHELRHAQKLEAVGTLASGMAHEFGNLLTALFAYFDNMDQILDQDHPAREVLNTARQVADRASGLTSSLLTFSRKAPAKRQPVELGELITASTSMLSQLLPANVQLDVQGVSSGQAWVSGDPNQLQQVLINLVINARDAMPGGGRILIKLSVGKNNVRIKVADAGVGIAPESLHRIFEPFYTTKPRGKGTGLGLAIIHGIISEHGGRIRCESVQSMGTRFTIELPKHEMEDYGVAPAMRNGKQSSSEPTVVLAEEDGFVRAAIEAALTREGLQLSCAADCPSVINALGTQEPCDLVILDMDLPPHGGEDCLREIRQRWSDVPVIMVTVAPRHSVEERPSTWLLQKPFEMSELKRLVREALHVDSPTSTRNGRK